MICTTSKEALAHIKETGKLKGMRLCAYEVLERLGEATGHELNAEADSPDLHKRLSELHRMRLISCTGSRKCRITGHRAKTWRVSCEVPDFSADAPRPKRMTRHELETRIFELEAKIAQLEADAVGEEARGQLSMFGAV